MLGLLSDRIGRRKPVIVASAIVATITWIPILFFPGIPLWLLISLVIIVGLANGSVTLGFAFSKESVPPRFAGTASGIYNMGSILGAMILQPAIGWLLDRNWQGGLAGGVRIYDLAAYRSGFCPHHRPVRAVGPGERPDLRNLLPAGGKRGAGARGDDRMKLLTSAYSMLNDYRTLYLFSEGGSI